MDWSQQGGAVVSPARLTDGRTARIVLVADRTNPKGAMLLFADKSAGQSASSFSEMLDAFHPNDVADILCMQERAFGSTGLEVPDIS